MPHNNYRIGKKNGTAQAMVELVIWIPLLLIIIGGIFQFALIYKAKITLNYATFQAVRTGTINNASLSKMETSFASNMAPLYTSSYMSIPQGSNSQTAECENNFGASSSDDVERTARVGTNTIMMSDTKIRSVLDNEGAGMDDKWSSEKVYCARRIVQRQIEDGFAKLTIINPSSESFTAFRISKNYKGDTLARMIPNDNLMYRNANINSTSQQSLQDANLLKLHVGYCYKMIIPFVNKIIHELVKEKSPPDANTLGAICDAGGNSALADSAENQRYGIPLYAQSTMRMQSDAYLCEITKTCGS